MRTDSRFDVDSAQSASFVVVQMMHWSSDFQGFHGKVSLIIGKKRAMALEVSAEVDSISISSKMKSNKAKLRLSSKKTTK